MKNLAFSMIFLVLVSCNKKPQTKIIDRTIENTTIIDSPDQNEELENQVIALNETINMLSESVVNLQQDLAASDKSEEILDLTIQIEEFEKLIEDFENQLKKKKHKKGK